MAKYSLTPHNYDGVVSALLGNGELCTTVGPTGFHTAPDQQTDIVHKTQHFVLAGRRKSGPQHLLINFGVLSRRLFINGIESPGVPLDQAITIDSLRETYSSDADADVFSSVEHDDIVECNLSCAFLNANLFKVAGGVVKSGRRKRSVRYEIHYDLPESAMELDPRLGHHEATIGFKLDDHLGEIMLGLDSAHDWDSVELQIKPRGVQISLTAKPRSETPIGFTCWLHFSDRTHFQFPPDPRLSGFDRTRGIRKPNWQNHLGHSRIVTGDEIADRFRIMSLYTLRCQATPWSIPPTVSEAYWGAGTFHDEMYPFLGLLANNHVELAERIPYFRLTTLPQAMQRARGRGALYPWSSTEYGEERDPNGLWLTERFHLGQFAVCIWMLWLYNRDPIQLDDLYPVLREIARYFEMNMLERDSEGKLRTKACCDFDESVGEVTNGPFTICAAIASMEYAANAAEILVKDPLRIPRWRALAAELRSNLPKTNQAPEKAKRARGRANIIKAGGVSHADLKYLGTKRRGDLYAIPNEKPLHYSILGPIFPFRIDVDSPTARASAQHIHDVCRSTKGWKPGFSEVFEGSNWMWTAGHLGIVHALQGNGDLAWEAIKAAPESAGPFLSPNEHVDKDGVIHVPWFTTGCGGWLYALACLFVQVDESGTQLLPAVPSALPNARFRDLRADRGVLVSGEFQDGQLVSLTARAPAPMPWTCQIPARYMMGPKPPGGVTDLKGGWLTINIESLGTQPTSLLAHSRPMKKPKAARRRNRSNA